MAELIKQSKTKLVAMYMKYNKPDLVDMLIEAKKTTGKGFDSIVSDKIETLTEVDLENYRATLNEAADADNAEWARDNLEDFDPEVGF